MQCNRCGKKLKKAYRHKGLIYGPECVVKVGGFISKCGKVKIKDAEDDEPQMELFNEGCKEDTRKEG